MKEKLVKNGRKIKKGYFDPATGETRTDRKGKIRKRIQEEIVPGQEYDVFDLVADLSKRCNILERGLILLLKSMKDAGTMPASLSGYNDSIDLYVNDLMDGTYKARTDLVSDISDLYAELMRRDTKVTEILQEEGY